MNTPTHEAARACAAELERYAASVYSLLPPKFRVNEDIIARRMGDLAAERDAELEQARAEIERLRDKLSERMPT